MMTALVWTLFILFCLGIIFLANRRMKSRPLTIEVVLKSNGVQMHRVTLILDKGALRDNQEAGVSIFRRDEMDATVTLDVPPRS